MHRHRVGAAKSCWLGVGEVSVYSSGYNRYIILAHRAQRAKRPSLCDGEGDMIVRFVHAEGEEGASTPRLSYRSRHLVMVLTRKLSLAGGGGEFERI